VVFYVNDFQVFYYKNNKEYAQKLIIKLYKTYNLHDLKDIKSFLSIRVVRDRVAKMIWLVYDIYIKKITKYFKFVDRYYPSILLFILEFKKKLRSSYTILN
jgi:hypothetical protein